MSRNENPETTAGTTNSEALITLILPVSLDGETWHDVTFEGESAAYVDRQAATYIATYQDQLQIGITENADWSQFPITANTLFQSVYAVERAELSI